MRLKFFIFMLMSLPALAFAETKIYQAGTLQNLMSGVYTGSTTFAELAKRGNLGLGTGNGLDGEMVAIDGRFYLADSFGHTRKVLPTEKTPFAMVVKFQPQQHFTLSNVNNISQLQQSIDSHLASANLFYVIKVDGNFNFIKARSEIPPEKPYKGLAEVMQTNQKVFTLNNVRGSLIIFRSPNFVNPMSVPGYHIHFISNDRKLAGHVLDVNLKRGDVSLEKVNEFVLTLPATKEYEQGNFNPVNNEAVNKVEKQH